MKLTAGIIGPAHGLKGEAIVDVRTDDPEVFEEGTVLEVESDSRELTIASVRLHKGRVLVCFDEVGSREEIEGLRGRRLLVEAHDEEDAWYPHDLEGCRALDPDGVELGTITGLVFGAAQDLLRVRTSHGPVLVPFVRELVPEVDIDARTVTIDAPPGLFDDAFVDADDRESSR